LLNHASFLRNAFLGLTKWISLQSFLIPAAASLSNVLNLPTTIPILAASQASISF
jgi:hypothetical protein